MIVIKNKFIPFKGYETINLFGILFTRDDFIDPTEYNHESIHSVQILECMILSAVIITAICIMFNISWWWLLLSIFMYYIQYGLEYVIIRFFHTKQNEAYHDVSFEEEAYKYEYDLNYIKHRIPFSWIKYIKIKSSN